MSGVLLDTHSLVWLTEGSRRMGREARRLAEEAGREDRLFVSAITFWEAAMLAQRDRLELDRPVSEWRGYVLRLGIVEMPVSGEIGIAAVELAEFPPDPADRIIGATAMLNGIDLMTADVAILRWPGFLPRHDASR